MSGVDNHNLPQSGRLFILSVPGTHVWLGMDWDAAHSSGATFMPVRRHISFGITQQFRLHL
jgi:hypothetical protein